MVLPSGLLRARCRLLRRRTGVSPLPFTIVVLVVSILIERCWFSVQFRLEDGVLERLVQLISVGRITISLLVVGDRFVVQLIQRGVQRYWQVLSGRLLPITLLIPFGKQRELVRLQAAAY